MRKLKYGLLGGAAALAAAMALPALSRAEPGMGGHGARLFEMTDTDKSGDISKAEMQAAAEARFEAADKNGDGVLTKDGSDAARAEMHEKMKAYRGDPAERFAAADADGDGRLTLEEMKEAAAKRMAEHGREGDMPGRHADRMEKFFEKADADGDGALTEDEMKAAGEKMKKRFSEHREKRGGLFGRLDTDSDGQVTKAELTESTGRMFDRMDKNEDGKIEPGEGRRGR